MRRYLQLLVWIGAPFMLQGCVGLGAWTLGSRTESSDHPKIGQSRGAIDIHKAGTEADLTTARDLRAQWGEPDSVESYEDGKDSWIYKTDGLRWAGMVLYVVVVPLPAMIPVGSQYVSFLIHDGQIERATLGDWAFKAGASCGFFGVTYGGFSCGTGTFEEKQSGGLATP